METNFGKRIVEFRKRNGISQDELANKIQVSRQTICNWESGEVSPSLNYINEMAKAFNVSSSDFIDFSKSVEDCYKEKVDINSKDIKDNKSGKGDKFKWDNSGIHILDNDSGDSVDIDLHGIHINSDKKDNGFQFVFNGEEERRKRKIVDNVASLIDGVMFLLLVAAYLTLGFIDKNNWLLYWPLFLTFDIPSAIIRTFGKKDGSKFPIVWIALTVYCFLGSFGLGWHPYWVIFFIIPIYYIICNSIKNIIKENKKAKIIKNSKIQ